MDVKLIHFSKRGPGLVPAKAPSQQTFTLTNINLSPNVSCGLHLKAISQEMLMNLICNICSEITDQIRNQKSFIQ